MSVYFIFYQLLLQFELDDRLLSKSEKQFVGQSSRSLDLSFLHYQQPPSKLLIYIYKKKIYEIMNLILIFYNLYEIFIASVKAKKIRSPVIEDHEWEKSCIIQTPVQPTTLKKGSLDLKLYFICSLIDLLYIFRNSKV